jgi:hypothetical protein
MPLNDHPRRRLNHDDHRPRRLAYHHYVRLVALDHHRPLVLPLDHYNLARRFTLHDYRLLFVNDDSPAAIVIVTADHQASQTAAATCQQCPVLPA